MTIIHEREKRGEARRIEISKIGFESGAEISRKDNRGNARRQRLTLTRVDVCAWNGMRVNTREYRYYTIKRDN